MTVTLSCDVCGVTSATNPEVFDRGFSFYQSGTRRLAHVCTACQNKLDNVLYLAKANAIAKFLNLDGAVVTDWNPCDILPKFPTSPIVRKDRGGK